MSHFIARAWSPSALGSLVRGPVRSVTSVTSVIFVASVTLVAACKDASSSKAAAAQASASTPSLPSPPAPADSPAHGPLVLAPANQIRWTEPALPVTDAAASVHTAFAQAKEDGRTLIVYVGATWCEPCQRFHHAVERGELDTAFPKLTVLAFDADRDSEALATAGYVSRLIPLFALPRADGRASGRTIEGSVKGEQAVAEITPRLRALLANE